MKLHARRKGLALISGFLFSLLPGRLVAQGEQNSDPAAPPPTPPTAKAAAPEDITGQWMSLVTEDWGYRMIMPLKGDYKGVPLNPAGKKAADAWDPAKPDPTEDACTLARRAGSESAARLGPNLGRRELLRLVTVFRRTLLPRRPPARKRKESITAAHQVIATPAY